MARAHGRTDANHTEIQRCAETIGASWLSLADLGHGAPDALIGWRGHNFLIEIKDGAKPASQRRLTPDERRWHDAWRGQVVVVESREELLRLLSVRTAT